MYFNCDSISIVSNSISIMFQLLHVFRFQFQLIELMYFDYCFISISISIIEITLVAKTTAGCFAALRQIRSIRRSLPPAAIQTLVVSLVLSGLDYGNATLAGIPAYLLRRLQSVLNAAARTIVGLPRSAHISTTLADLH